MHPRATPTLPFHTTHLVLENMLDSAPPRRLLKGGAYDATQDAPALIDGCAHHLRVLQFLNKVPVLLAASNAVHTSTFPKLFFSIPSLASSTYFRTWPLAFTACRTKPRSRCNFVLQNLKALPHWATASSVRSESPRRSEEANLWCGKLETALPKFPASQIAKSPLQTNDRSLREAAYGSRMVQEWSRYCKARPFCRTAAKAMACKKAQTNFPNEKQQTDSSHKRYLSQARYL